MLEADGKPAYRHHGGIRAPGPPRKAVRPAEEVGLQQHSQVPETGSPIRGGRLAAKILDLAGSGRVFEWLWEQPRNRCVRSTQFRLTRRGNHPAKPPVCRVIAVCNAGAGSREASPETLEDPQLNCLPFDARCW